MKRENPQHWLERIQRGDKVALSKAITLLESNCQEHTKHAQVILQLALPHSGKSFRLGITGVPGAGKSTLIDAFGMSLLERGKKVAVLTVDPSSTRSGGSILGDKTRMLQLSRSDRTFIRPSASGGKLGGVARKTREAIVLCEAAGYDFIIVETMGVGQSEIEVHDMTDFFLLLHLSGAGDTLQGVKRGIMEVVEAIAVHKADGDKLREARYTQSQLRSALHFFPPMESGWTPQVLLSSALEKRGLSELWDLLQAYEKQTRANGYFEKRRKEQGKKWFYDTLNELILNDFYARPETQTGLESCMRAIADSTQSPYRLARQLFEQKRKS